MKKIYQHYITYTEEQLKDIWSNAVFVFDSSALLNVYKYGSQLAQKYMAVLSDLKTNGKLFMPYQVGYEFHENNHNVIHEYMQSYETIIGSLKKATEIFSRFRYHPTLPMSDIKSAIDSAIDEQIERINQISKSHPKEQGIKDITESIYTIFDNVVGEQYNEEKLKQIYKEGKERYAKLVPPGYKDDKKGEPKCYGDLIVWNQLMDHAKQSKKNIIFITDDAKDDWWLKRDGRTIMPRIELRKEFLDKTQGMYFHMYSPQNFLEYYQRNNSSAVNIEKSSLQIVGQISIDGVLNENNLDDNINLLADLDIKAKLADIADRLNNITSSEFFHNDLELYEMNLDGLRSQYNVFSSLVEFDNQRFDIITIQCLIEELIFCRNKINQLFEISASAEILDRDMNGLLHTTMFNIDTLVPILSNRVNQKDMM